MIQQDRNDTGTWDLYNVSLSSGRAGDMSTSEKRPTISSVSSAKHSKPAIPSPMPSSTMSLMYACACKQSA